MKSNNKAQTSVEFMILLGFTIVVAAVLIGVLETNLSSTQIQRDQQRADEVFSILMTEIEFADQTRPTFQRQFYIPFNIGGQEYDINIIDRQEVVITYNNKQYVYFLPQRVEGDVAVGNNLITKECFDVNCVITLQSIEPEVTQALWGDIGGNIGYQTDIMDILDALLNKDLVYWEIGDDSDKGFAISGSTLVVGNISGLK